ncbi:hypothetical protein FRC08_011596 [Ceratobasidium sp. 394]|nr:hypothetical protein FRC08_011596 [Ceratobasidium sp. 394]KAG9092241.1 hypothetical protein FS749_015899 [Ceratobasidium sp. UAMH 11750]
MISSSPRLHTLRLKDISVPFTESDQARVHSSIDLPYLRLFDIADLDISLLILLLSLLCPGPLALDFRLQTLHYYSIFDAVVLFFERSNITSLYMENEDPGIDARYAGAPPFGWYPYLSQLRILFLSGSGRDGALLDCLTTPNIRGRVTALAPSLHTLVLFDSHLNDPTRGRVKRVVEAYSLRRIIFRNSPNLDEHSVDGESDAGSGVEAPNETKLGDFRDWLSQRVEIVIFEPQQLAPDSMEEWDMYVQALMSSLGT